MADSGAIQVDHVLFLLVLIFVLGMVSGWLARIVRVPDVVLFIAAGILFGQGLHLVSADSGSFTNRFILAAGAALILFDGGRNIRLRGLRQVWVTVALLATTGVLVTVAVVGAAARLIFGLPWPYALLLAAIIASTDPATIIPVFKQVRIRVKVRETVESESAFNDATGSIIAFTLLALIMDHSGGGGGLAIGPMLLAFARTALGGVAVGLAFGFLFAFLASHFRLSILKEYATIAMVVAALAASVTGDLLGVSGLMATFTAGLIWGNAGLFGMHMKEKETEMTHFTDNLTTIMRMLIFILLGSQVDLAVVGRYFLPGLAIVAILVVAARPLTVLASALWDKRARWEKNELLFMFWVRETGVIPAALAGTVAASGIAHTDILSAVTFLTILATILVQASTTGFAARRLGLEITGREPREGEGVTEDEEAG